MTNPPAEQPPLLPQKSSLTLHLVSLQRTTGRAPYEDVTKDGAMPLQAIGSQDHDHHQRLGRCREGPAESQRETYSDDRFLVPKLWGSPLLSFHVALQSRQVAWERDLLKSTH